MKFTTLLLFWWELDPRATNMPSTFPKQVSIIHHYISKMTNVVRKTAGNNNNHDEDNKEELIHMTQ